MSIVTKGLLYLFYFVLSFIGLFVFFSAIFSCGDAASCLGNGLIILLLCFVGAFGLSAVLGLVTIAKLESYLSKKTKL